MLQYHGRPPWELLNLSINEGLRCDFCYKDVPDDNGKHIVHFHSYFLNIYTYTSFF